MSNPETILQTEIRLALGREPDLVLWRNGIGLVDRQTATGQRYKQRFGLATGSSDLIGILSVPCLIGAAHVPITLGRLVALEVKTPRGVTSDDQRAFLALVRSKGGFAAIVRSVAEAEQAIARARLGASE